MSASPSSRLYTSLAIAIVLLALGITDLVMGDHQVRPWILLGFGGWTGGSAVVQLRRERSSATDPTLRQAFWMFTGFFLFGIITIAVATTKEGLTLGLWLVLGAFVAAFGGLGLYAVAWTYRAERSDRSR